MLPGMDSRGRKWSLGLASVLLLALRPGAQESKPRVPRTEEPPPPKRQELSIDPEHAFEFAIGGDGLLFAYRSGLHRRRGYESLGVFVSRDNDFALDARLMRFGQPSADTPLGLGIGLGLFGAEIDDVNDEALAITLIGAADYALEEVLGVSYPLRAGLELSYAPDVATFLDGKRVLGIQGRVELDLSTWATAFVGYRRLDVDLENESDAKLDRAFHAGVRLGF